MFPTLTPIELDEMQLWQIAVLLELDVRPPHFQLPAVVSRPLPPQSDTAEEVASPTRRLRAVL